VKNDWLKSVIEDLEDKQFHGKVILNVCSGNIPNIEIQERINKPTENNNGKEERLQVVVVKAF
jgi:hypothetical protein